VKTVAIVGRAQEAELVRRAAIGDPTAYDALVERYQGPLLTFAYRYLGDRQEAEDAAQDAFVRVYLSLGRLRQPERFASYLFTAALNTCRRRARPRPSAAPADHRDAAGDPQATVLYLDEQETVAAAITALPDEYREVVSLRVGEDLGFAEIGRIVGATEGACRVRFHRAKEMLRELLTLSRSPSEERA
jgi:RNA polymerase sigma-70 factor, ECF subfamily